MGRRDVGHFVRRSVFFVMWMFFLPALPKGLRCEVAQGLVWTDIVGLRIAWSPDYGFAAVDPEVLEVTKNTAQVFEELGCHVENSDLVLNSPYDAYGPIYEFNAYASYGQYLKSHGEQMTNFARDFIEAGAKVTATDYAKALGLIDRLKA